MRQTNTYHISAIAILSSDRNPAVDSVWSNPEYTLEGPM